jgi:hypothetical protein
MTSRTPMRRWIFFFAATLITAAVITTGGLGAKRQQPKEQAPKKQWPKEPRVTSMPQVFSKVKNLEVVKAWIEDQDTAVPNVAVEIRNNSNKDVMAVDLVCGEGGITRSGLTDEEHPIVVMEPHGTTTIRMNFSSMTFGAPLVVSAVTYADGTEEGEEASLRAMHIARAHDRADFKARKKREAEKGATKP